MNWAVRNGAETESIMNSVERVLYTTLQTPQVQYSTIQYIPTPQVCYVPSAIYLLLCPLGYIYPVLYPLCYVLLLCAPLLLYTMFYIPYLMSPCYILAHSSLPSPTVSSLYLIYSSFIHSSIHLFIYFTPLLLSSSVPYPPSPPPQERPRVVDDIPSSAYHLPDAPHSHEYDPLGNPLAQGLGLGLAPGQGLGGLQSPLANTFPYKNLVHPSSSMSMLSHGIGGGDGGVLDVIVMDIPLTPVDLLNPSQPLDHIPSLPPPPTPQLPSSDAELLASGWPWRGGITFNGLCNPTLNPINPTLPKPYLYLYPNPNQP